MQGVIDSRVISGRLEFADRFRRAAPFPHLVIDGFFSRGFCAKLIAEFPPFDRGCSLNENGRSGGKATVEDIRSLGETFARADDLFQSQEFALLVSDLTGIPDLLYDAEYIGGGTHENLPGQDLDPHVDFNYHPRKSWHRRLNLIVYLNPEWEEAWGGSLELHQDPWLPPDQNHVDRIVPLANRAILFETSERSWHGFEAIRPPPDRPRISRRSLAIYMYTKERPAAETAPPHATVYVERPLPFVLRPGEDVSFPQYDRVRRMLTRRMEHIERLQERERAFTRESMALVSDLLASGHPLTTEQIDLVGALFRREDSLLKTHYDREKEFTRDIGALRAAAVEPSRTTLATFGKARLTLPPWGHYRDQWAAPSLQLELRAAGPATMLTLHGELPDTVLRRQRLQCAIGDCVHTIDLTVGSFAWSIPVSIAAGESIVLWVWASESLLPTRDVPNSPDDRELAYKLLAVDLC